MKDFPGKSKPTLESLMADQKVMRGKDLIKQRKEEALDAAHQKTILDEAIEFEKINRRKKAM